MSTLPIPFLHPTPTEPTLPYETAPLLGPILGSGPYLRVKCSTVELAIR